MTGLDIEPLAEGLGFGARVRGATLDTIGDPDVRDRLIALSIVPG